MQTSCSTRNKGALSDSVLVTEPLNNTELIVQFEITCALWHDSLSLQDGWIIGACCQQQYSDKLWHLNTARLVLRSAIWQPQEDIPYTIISPLAA